MRNLLLALVVGAAVAACGAKHDGATGDDTAIDAPTAACSGSADCPSGEFCSGNGTCIDNGLCKVDGDCPGGMVCGPAGTCVPSMCGGTKLDLTYVEPNFIIALDRSCSMTQKLSGTTTTKWEAAVAALTHVLSVYGTDIRWGATLFPDTTGDKCTQDAIPFPIADGNAPGITTLLNNALGSDDPLFPDGPCVTPIDTGVEQAATDPALNDTTRPGFVMLVTDGAQAGCSAGGGSDGTAAAITTLLGRGIKTFVVGFGSEVDKDAMNTFATNGGEALAGATKYYQADTADALDAAFQTIAGLTVSCQYVVSPAPTDLDETYVYFSGNQLVPRDTTHMDGWDYDPASMELTLYGNDCTVLQNHTVTEVDVLFGCPTPPIQ